MVPSDGPPTPVHFAGRPDQWVAAVADPIVLSSLQQFAAQEGGDFAEFIRSLPESESRTVALTALDTATRAAVRAAGEVERRGK